MKSKLLFCLTLVLSDLPGHNCSAAIIFPKAPEGGRQIIYERVDRHLRAFPRFFGGLKIEELTIADSHQIYSAVPRDVISGKLLSAARLTGWRYLLTHGTNAVGEAWLYANPEAGKALKFISLFGDRFAQPTLVALRQAEELPQVKKQDYEFRYLNMPSMSFFAVWLRGKSDDIIIPLPPTSGMWNAYQPYSQSQIIKLLKPEAEKWLKTEQAE